MQCKRPCPLYPPIATAKANFRTRSCPLCPQKRTCAVHLRMSAMGHVWTAPSWQELFFTLQHWSVRPCVRPHMMVSPSSADWADRDPRRGSHHCRLSLQTSHPAGVDPNHCPAFGTGELQENGTTLCKRRRSAMPNNGDVPSDWRAAPHSQRRPDCGAD